VSGLRVVGHLALHVADQNVRSRHRKLHVGRHTVHLPRHKDLSGVGVLVVVNSDGDGDGDDLP
jgi:hypothetical protein